MGDSRPHRHHVDGGGHTGPGHRIHHHPDHRSLPHRLGQPCQDRRRRYDGAADERQGRHACYDRLVIDVPGAGKGVGYRVGYVERLHQDGSGRPVPVAGKAVLEIRVMAPAYDPETGAPTYPGRAGRPLPGVDLTGYRTFRDARFAGSFEGESQLGLGLRARLPFRVTQTADRVVVDVAHNWTGSR
ncbi:hypothetical protein SGLAM104S_03566 [Streptomyces glaucescens]